MFYKDLLSWCKIIKVISLKLRPLSCLTVKIECSVHFYRRPCLIQYLLFALYGEPRVLDLDGKCECSS